MPKPAPRRPNSWTVMIVPHGSEATHTMVVSRRALRALRSAAAGIGVILCAVGIGATVAGASLRGSSRGPQDPATSGGASRETVDSLRRALALVGEREAHIRVLAGLAPVDSAPLDTASDGPPADVRDLLRRAERLSLSFAEVSDTLQHRVKQLESLPSIMPTAGWLTSEFSRGRRHPILHITRPHEGIDVSAPMGAPIVAPAAGVIIRVGRESGYGNVLEIDHGNGIVTKFAHCSRINVRQGQRVTRGQVVANVGNSGLATGPHLHYEIHVNGRVVDPLTYVLPGAIPD